MNAEAASSASSSDPSWFSAKEPVIVSVDKYQHDTLGNFSWVSSVTDEELVKRVREAASSSSAATKAEEEQQRQRTVNTRLTKSKGKEISESEGGKIGGEYAPVKNPAFLKRREEVYKRIMQKQVQDLATNHEVYPRSPIKIALPDGSEKDGVAWETTPMSIAQSISRGLADSVIVAKVFYSNRVGKLSTMQVSDSSGLDDADKGDGDGAHGIQAATGDKSKHSSVTSSNAAGGILWDLLRPLEGDCKLFLLKFDDPEAMAVFWHSSAHVLGECLECEMGCHLTVGPPVQQGFYYDSYMGKHTIDDKQRQDIEEKAKQVCKEKQVFERIVLSKEEALEMFADNPFKVSIITNKIKDGTFTTAYRCGPLIDLCMGPHVPDTGRIKEFMITRINAAYWLGKEGNDSLQRVYGVSFPDSKQMKAYKQWKEHALENDHRNRGQQQHLFFFDKLSPGSAFFEPHGARIYNCLMAFIRSEYRKRGYQEVITPNMFNVDLWKLSGHWEHYKKNMFSFGDGEELLNEKGQMEGQMFALKPMNCPGHCLMFKHRSRSFRELPLRMADFGVLHRNEKSGALTGLTRVRRFQQDDAHIFCRKDQIKQEVSGALQFMHYVYHDVFGMTYKLDRSTRPDKACGLETAEGVALWDLAEAQLAEVLDEFVGHDNWRDNPGDGAFYGPKIDIKVFDVMGRQHQCATIQLDFQLPINFGLSYISGAASSAGGDGDDEDTETAAATTSATSSAEISLDAASSNTSNSRILKPGYERPVMVHRAMLGSIERMMAILIENFGGKYPFWLSPRQATVIPLHYSNAPYAQKVSAMLNTFYVDVEDSNKTYKKKIRDAATMGYNYMLVVGKAEEEAGTLSIRGRAEVQHGVHSIETVRRWFEYLCEKKLTDEMIPKDASALDVVASGSSASSSFKSAPSGATFTINGQQYRTKVKKLTGRSFPSLQAFTDFMKAA